MSESTVIETYGAIIVDQYLILGSINKNECTALQLLTLAGFLNFTLYTKYECTVIQYTGVLIVQWFKSENSLGSVDS